MSMMKVFAGDVINPVIERRVTWMCEHSVVDQHPSLLFLSRADPCGDSAECICDRGLGKLRERFLKSLDHADLREILALDLFFEGRQLIMGNHLLRYGRF